MKVRASSLLGAPPAPAPAREVFRGLEKGLMEVDFSGKVFIKQGTIYSYSGNLTFWVKDMRPGARPPLVIVTGTGRLLLTDVDREITFMQVAEEPVFVEPAHLLACEESLQPRYTRLGDEGSGLEDHRPRGPGHGRARRWPASRFPLTVKPGLPVSVPASSVIMWTGELTPHVVDDPQVYAVVLGLGLGSRPHPQARGHRPDPRRADGRLAYRRHTHWRAIGPDHRQLELLAGVAP